MLKRVRAAAGCAALAFCPLLGAQGSATSPAQAYPAKAVRIIVPVGAGGATDILSRTLGQRLALVWGQQVVVDNRPGGGSNIGFELSDGAGEIAAVGPDVTRWKVGDRVAQIFVQRWIGGNLLSLK